MTPHLRSAGRTAASATFRLSLAALGLAAVLGAATAHSWYPYDCCSDKDCFAVEAANVKTVTGGWMLEDGTFIGYREARPSPDGQFHVCRYEDGKGKLIALAGQPACFWAPIGAS